MPAHQNNCNMKKRKWFIGLLALFVLLAISSSSFAQLTKGNWLVGGTGKFYSYTSTYSTPTISYESKYLDVNLAPGVGYFVVDKFAIGLKPSFNWTKSKTYPPGGGSTDIKRFTLGPFARYYILNSESQFNIVTEGTYQYGIYRAGADKGSINNFSIMAGPVVYFNTTVGLEFLIGYTSSIEEIKNRYKNTLKGYQIGVGLQIHLEK